MPVWSTTCELVAQVVRFRWQHGLSERHLYLSVHECGMYGVVDAAFGPVAGKSRSSDRWVLSACGRAAGIPTVPFSWANEAAMLFMNRVCHLPRAAPRYSSSTAPEPAPCGRNLHCLRLSLRACLFFARPRSKPYSCPLPSQLLTPTSPR